MRVKRLISSIPLKEAPLEVFNYDLKAESHPRVDFEILRVEKSADDANHNGIHISLKKLLKNSFLKSFFAGMAISVLGAQLIATSCGRCRQTLDTL